MSKVYLNIFGSPYKIVEFVDGSHVIVEFQDEHKVRKSTVVEAAINGNVKNPYDKSCYGIGYLGEGYQVLAENKSSKMHKTWYGMIERCYAEKYKDKYPAYHGIATVKESWLNYQNFAKWYIENEYKCEGRLHLDKDILVPGNKVYSKDTCLLVPQRINMIFMEYQRTIDADLPVGIRRTANGKKYNVMYNTTYIGTYKTVEECVELYNKAKREHIKKVADEYKNIIPAKVYNALMNW